MWNYFQLIVQLETMLVCFFFSSDEQRVGKCVSSVFQQFSTYLNVIKLIKL